MQLLIMAAGMGSRFGGPEGSKQICQVGPKQELIIDYSVYDAKKAGFNKVVFIIKEEQLEKFKNLIGDKVEKFIDVEYVFQTMDNVPDFVKIPEGRTKPWGTAQAIYCAKDAITEPFVVINADDFYGQHAFIEAARILNSDNKYSTIGYKAKNTMTENGTVKRGVIKEENGLLKSITESKLKYVDGKIVATPLGSNESFIVEDDDLVSMNMLTFDLSIFDYIEKNMVTFFKENENDLNECEYLIPVLLNKLVHEGLKVKCGKTDSEWYGITYKEDVEEVKENLKRLTLNNVYPSPLWK